MRTLQTLFAGLVAIALIVGGLAVAAVVALAAVAIMLANRLFGRKHGLRSTPAPTPGVRREGPEDAIDIEAAEVTSPHPRIESKTR